MTAAPFFSRNGTLLGVHNKNMLYDPEEDYGVSRDATASLSSTRTVSVAS